MSDPLRISRLAPWLVATAVVLPSAAVAQQIDLPRPSPKATVSQTVGVTEFTLAYGRPAVRERKIWGGLVPYGEVWRTGANENTTLKASTAFKINGQELSAGVYGVQTIPNADEWTVILSKDSQEWGAYSYKPENDAVRFTVKPEAAEHAERLSFSFEDVTDDKAEVVLRWEKVQVPFTLEVDTAKLTAERAKSAIRWQTPYQAANYCLQNDTCLDDAGRWLDASLALQEVYPNLRAKALLLSKKQDWKGAAAWGEKAIAAAKASQTPPPADAIKELEGWVADWKKK